MRIARLSHFLSTDLVRPGARAPRRLAAGLADIWLVARILAWALVLPALKYLLPLQTLARLMWTGARRDDDGRQPAHEERIAALVRRIHGLGPFRGDGNCLERSLVTYRILSGRNAGPRLVVGVRKDGEKVLGHVWVTVDGHPIGESRALLRGFVPVVIFGEGGATETKV